MAFDVSGAGLPELEKEFNRLADNRDDYVTAFRESRAALEAMLAEYQEIYGRVEVIASVTVELLGSEIGSDNDGSLADDPFVSDFLDTLDAGLAEGGRLGGLGSFIKLGYDIRKSNALRAAARVTDTAGDVAARSIVAWPKLKRLGGLAGVASSGLGIALMVRDAQERKSFYQSNIPIYEEWAADLQSKVDSFNGTVVELDNDLDDLQAKLGFTSRAEMKRELKRTVGDVSEYRAQWIALTKMLCKGVSVDDAEIYTGFPLALVRRRAQELTADPSVCPPMR